ELFGDTDGRGPGFRYQQADDVAADDAEQAEVEQRAADPQQAVLVELGGAGGPAELVVAVTPEVAGDEHGQTDVGHDDPQELIHVTLLARSASAGRRVGPISSRPAPRRAVACRTA